MMLSLFSCMCLAICMSSLEKCLFSSYAHFFFFWIGLFKNILSCLSCLYILEIKPYQLLCLQIFSPIRGLVLFMVSFAVQKRLSLVRFHLYIFVLIFITLGGGSERVFLLFMSKSVLPVFSSKSFMFCCVTSHSYFCVFK